MISISGTFKKCKEGKKKVLIPYLTSGYPDEKVFLRLLTEFSGAGADMIEVGIPFSDPMADGKTIQYSSQKALENAVTVEKTFYYLSGLPKGCDTPIIIMSYYNPIHSFGVTRFVKSAKRVGVRGLVIPDLVPEEGKSIERVCRQQGIDLIYLLAPTSSAKRRKMIVHRSMGFVYLVSVAGVTGARKFLPNNLGNWIREVKKESPIPVCVGFGISNLQQVREVCQTADGVIIGSAIIEMIKNTSSARHLVKETREFIKHLRIALNHDSSSRCRGGNSR